MPWSVYTYRPFGRVVPFDTSFGSIVILIHTTYTIINSIDTSNDNKRILCIERGVPCILIYPNYLAMTVSEKAAPAHFAMSPLATR